MGLVEVLAEEKKQTLSLTGDRNLSVHADRTVLWQAIANLLDNAVKYSPIGSEIRIHLGRLPSDSSDLNLLELTIEDEGPGIPEELASKVFDRFYRIDDSHGRWIFTSLAAGTRNFL